MGRALYRPLIADRFPGDPPNRLKLKDHRTPGNAKSFSTSPPVSMAQMKEMRAGLRGATVNDVLMTLTTLTLQEYFRREEPATLKQKVRASFPMNLRTVEGKQVLAEEHFGNRWSQGQLRFPLHLRKPLETY